MSHRPRGKVRPETPVHVTLRVRRDVPALRAKDRFRTVARALRAAVDRLGVRVVHFSVQRTHVHLLVQADDAAALGRGMQGLSVRLAKAINRAARRHGAVFVDRYHSHVLRTPREIRHALSYILNNARKHAAQLRIRYLRDWVDPCSSAAWFDGWAASSGVERLQRVLDVARAKVAELLGEPGGWTPRPRGWLLTTGWRRHGLLRVDEVPAV